jgi:glutamate racemase
MTELAGNIQIVREKVRKAAIRAGTDPNAICLVAVSKTAGPEEIGVACQNGITDFGENRVQDLLRKQSEYPQAKWHMIGHLQTNKVKDIVGRVGVLATGVTLAGERFNSLVERFGNGVEVHTQPCPGLVEMVERGHLDHPETEELLAGYLNRLLDIGVDTVVLGCTHYPFLRPLIEKLTGEGVSIIDTGQAVAKQVSHVLESHDLLNPHGVPGHEHFYTSGNPREIQPVIRGLWKDPDLMVEKVLV